MMRRAAIWPSVVAIIVLFSACSSFDARWKRAQADPKLTRWDGHWTSEKHHKSNGEPMGGRLRCITAPSDAQKLAAHFHANWLIFASDYTTVLKPVRPGPVKNRDAVREYRGTHELPAMFGGTYRYEARISRDRFNARYTSSYDHGVFTLRRVHLAKDCFPSHARD